MNDSVLTAYAAAKKRSADGDAWAQTFAQQADILRKEFLRQCGTDNEGNHPQECVDALSTATANVTANVTVQEALLQAIRLGDPSGILTAVYAAAATEQPAPELNQAKALPLDQIVSGHTDLQEDLTQLLSLTYAAIYASGVALAADGGNNRTIMAAIASRLRRTRDDICSMLENMGQAVPEAQAGYISPDGEPTDSASAARYFHTALAPITVQLRKLATEASNETAREYDARWAGLMARGEAVLEPLFGEDPRSKATRGDV